MTIPEINPDGKLIIEYKPITHIAKNKLGPNGELYRCCDGKEMQPMLGDWEEGTLNFCVQCKKIAKATTVIASAEP